MQQKNRFLDNKKLKDQLAEYQFIADIETDTSIYGRQNILFNFVLIVRWTNREKSDGIGFLLHLEELNTIYHQANNSTIFKKRNTNKKIIQKPAEVE